MFSGDVGKVAEKALEEGLDGLRRFGPRLFHSVAPMLANPAEGETDALERLGNAAREYEVETGPVCRFMSPVIRSASSRATSKR